jgi:DNA-binding beta-propeller fold protein YncE
MGNCNCKHGNSGTSHACPECDILQMARNNYFTGKLLVERDFTDEQRYTMGKLRRHNQRLHGWGVACGLKVEQHPNPACQGQYVVIEPGTAIDCCGREILVPCEDYFDFEAKFLANWQKQNGAASQPDQNPHTLQICVGYKECSTENVPALFDDCSGNAGACQPNRILESYSFDVITDPAPSPTDPQGVALTWQFTENIANAVRVVEDDAGGRLYVLTSSTNAGVSSAALYAFDTTNYALLGSINYASSAGLDVAVSSSGDLVYVIEQPATGAPQLHAYSASDLTTSISQSSIGTAADATVLLAVVPDEEGALLTFGQTVGVISWTSANAAAPVWSAIAGVASPLALVIDSAAQFAYVASTGSAALSVITIATMTASATVIALPAAPTSLAIAKTTLGQTIAALDASDETLYFIQIPAAGPGAAAVVNQTVTGFIYPPTQVLLSPAGRWAYVLEEEAATGNGYLQTVDEHAVELAETSVLGTPVPVGAGPQSEALSADGTHLYVAYSEAAQPALGGVAVLAVTQTDCGGLFETLIDGCPDCEQGDCLVLATISGYVYGSAVTNSEIDNLTDRQLLVSTSKLTEVVQCLLTQGSGSSSGEQGPPGPPGPPGQPGTNGTNGTNGVNGANGTNGTDGTNGTNGIDGTNGANGANGKDGTDGKDGPGLQTGLVQISALSWVHGNLTQQNAFIPIGGGATPYSANALVIAFTGPINSPADPNQAFEVLYDFAANDSLGMPYLERRVLVAQSIQNVDVTFDTTNSKLITAASIISTGMPTKALAFVPANYYLLSTQNIGAQIWVRLRGDFLLDTNNQAVSATFVRSELPTGEQPSGSGLCLQGGTFESWFKNN